MQSILLPTNIKLSVTSVNSTLNNTSSNIATSTQNNCTYLKRVGPRGTFIKKRGDFSFSQIVTTAGTRVFVSGVSPKKEALILAQLSKHIIGISRGYRKRLRLVGIGFRGIKQSRSVSSSNTREVLPLDQQDKPSQNAKKALRPKYRVRQLKGDDAQRNKKRECLVLKLGYSHESVFSLVSATKKNRLIDISRPESRTKGTVIQVEGANSSQVSNIATEIQQYRLPDIYKGKGIHANGVSLKLKKGKRQG